MNFTQSIVGQGKALNYLQNIYQSGNIPHAFLFSGNEGIGKFFTAIEFVKLINNNYASESVIKKISNLSEPYIKFVFPLPRAKSETSDDSPTAKLNDKLLQTITGEIKKKIENPYYKLSVEKAYNIKISSIRNINKFLSFSYDEIKYRAILISDAHLMNNESQNALLKNLEEPPAGVIFILLTPQKDKLLPTIISRCWKVPFQPLQAEDVVEILKRYFYVEDKIAKLAAKFSDGSVQKALYLIDKEIEYIIDRTIFILRYSLARKYLTAYKELIKLLDSSGDMLNIITGMISKWFLDALKNKYDHEDYYYSKYSETFVKFNEKFKDVSINEISSKIDILNGMQQKKVNLNLIAMNIILELASIRMR